MTERDADQLLVERVQRGDKRAFDLLVRKYQHRVIAVINRYVRDPDEAMDIAQETFVKAYRALDRFRGESAFYTWIFRIAVNTAKNFIVARGRRPPDADVAIEDAEYHDGGIALHELANPENQLFRDELEQAVQRALDKLPEDLRAAVTLREFDGLSYEEIAEVMDCPIGTVRSRIFRAREVIDNEIRQWVVND
ncbi:RNA polymerase sigma-24 factor [gamma proteobacterium HdN1]|nr:RNA polymerase sigma-24 factor [gamma proteobacterium HdN1]